MYCSAYLNSYIFQNISEPCVSMGTTNVSDIDYFILISQDNLSNIYKRLLYVFKAYLVKNLTTLDILSLLKFDF